jgi:hypothetical protein
MHVEFQQRGTYRSRRPDRRYDRSARSGPAERRGARHAAGPGAGAGRWRDGVMAQAGLRAHVPRAPSSTVLAALRHFRVLRAWPGRLRNEHTSRRGRGLRGNRGCRRPRTSTPCTPNALLGPTEVPPANDRDRRSSRRPRRRRPHLAARGAAGAVRPGGGRVGVSLGGLGTAVLPMREPSVTFLGGLLGGERLPASRAGPAVRRVHRRWRSAGMDHPGAEGAPRPGGVAVDP